MTAWAAQAALSALVGVLLGLVVVGLSAVVMRTKRPDPIAANEGLAPIDGTPGSELHPTGQDRAVELTNVLPHEEPAREEQKPEGPKGAPRGTVTGTAFINYMKNGLALVTGPITARALGPVGRGIVSLVSIYDSLTTALFSAGIPGAAGYYAAKGRFTRQALMGSVVRLSFLLLPVVAFTAFGVFVGPMAKFGTPVRVAAVILVLQSPISAVGLTGRVFILADQDLSFLRLNDLVPILMNAAIVIPFGLLGLLTVPLAVTAIILGNLASVVWCYIRAGVHPKGRTPYKPLMSYGLRSLLGNLANFANNSLDQALVAPLLGVRALGVYSVGVTVSTLPLGLASAFGYRTFGSVLTADRSGAITQAESQIRITLLTAAVFCLVLAAASPLIPIIYGNGFQQAVSPMLILLPGTVALAVTLTATFSSAAIGVPQYATYGAVAGLVITLPGLAVAIPTMGINGAALVSTVAYTVRAGLNLILLRRAGVRRVIPGWRDVTGLVTTIHSRTRAVRRRISRRRK